MFLEQAVHFGCRAVWAVEKLVHVVGIECFHFLHRTVGLPFQPQAVVVGLIIAACRKEFVFQQQASQFARMVCGLRESGEGRQQGNGG